ncbi:MAG: class D beta-lactamase [Solitalea-like symbiont of Tyrophagus putrescentiae]
MKKVILLLFSVMLSANVAFADSCFIAKEKDRVLKSEGNCQVAYAPMSTFKILLSLIGFDSGILVDETHPVWSFKEGYADWRDVWKQDQTPKSWIKESCVWYSQVLTKQLGMKKFQDYVTKFDYGNKDLSGDRGKQNGLTNSWLSGSLKVSGLEQVAFLEKMLAGKLPVKPHAIAMTKNILFVMDLKNGWKLYGKTGMGSLLNADGTKNPDLYHGWFVGWVEKGDRRIIFSNHVQDNKKEEIGASLRAKADAKERLTEIINQIET